MSSDSRLKIPVKGASNYENNIFISSISFVILHLVYVGSEANAHIQKRHVVVVLATKQRLNILDSFHNNLNEASISSTRDKVNTI
jgi:hypothetical protein